MAISIKQNGDCCIEYNQLKVHGREAVGGFGLTFALNGIHRGFDSPISIFDIQLALAVSDLNKPVANSIASSNQVIRLSQYPNTNKQLHFESILSKETLNSLEEYRQEGDLKLSLGLRALITSNGEPSSSFDQADFTIPREEWLTAVRNAGFRKSMLFEILLPNGEDKLDELYAKAQEFIEIGHYKDAVMQCRHIIECIETFRADKSLAIEANKMALDRQRRQEMTVEQRMMCFREQIKNVCQLGAHGNENFTRSQARAILGMTMALLSEPTVGFSSM